MSAAPDASAAEPEPEPMSAEPEPEPQPEAAAHPPEGMPPAKAQGRPPRAAEAREPPLFKNIRVVMFDIERGTTEPTELEDVDIHAPLLEVIAQIEEGDEMVDAGLYADDIKEVHTRNDSEKGGRGQWLDNADAEEFAETSLSDLGYEDGCSVGIATVQYLRDLDVRRRGYGRRGGPPGGAPEFGDLVEGEELQAAREASPRPLPTKAPQEAKTVNGKHRVPGSAVFDFRRCEGSALPPGVALIDPQAEDGADPPKPELEEQNDKSMALLLKSGCFLELDLDPDAPEPGAPRMKQRPTTAYTVTIDLKLEELPEDYLALFSPSSDAGAPSFTLARSHVRSRVA